MPVYLNMTTEVRFKTTANLWVASNVLLVVFVAIQVPSDVLPIIVYLNMITEV